MTEAPVDSKGHSRVYVAAILGVAAVLSAWLFSRAGVEAFLIKHGEKRVTVTGSATRRIKSDFVVWRATVKSQAPDMAQAYRKLAADVPEVVQFVKLHGVDEKQIKVAAATIEEIHPRDKEGHELPETTSAFVTQEVVEVSSGDIDKVEQISREATKLIDRGVYITSDAPLYIYTKLSELKVEMLAEASKDARDRATQIASHAGARITGLIVARMGVMQVNPAYSTAVSAEGNNDRSSLEKDALAIVTASFSVE
jgi:hypothetical protein